MKRLKLKKYVVVSSIIAVNIVLILSAVILNPNKEKELRKLNYVSNTIISQDQAVINTTHKVIYPYTDQSVKIGKSYYDYKSTAEEQENSLHYHENTYIQNSGVDFVYDNKFNVVSVLDGTVTNVKEDAILGKIVEITHDNDYISIYQSLGEVKVTKGDSVSQGQVIGISGTNEMDKDIGNHLHFEMYISGYNVNPINYLDKEVSKKN
jgi:stage II sporulation protein Q